MKIGYFGTPGISSYCLERLCKNHEILFVVTSPDKPKGRNRVLCCSETKNVAQCNDLPVFQPVKLKDEEFINQIKKFEADIFVVVAYGKIIPPEVYEIPRLKTINLHPSLLPKYRGAAPINWVLINGGPLGTTCARIGKSPETLDDARACNWMPILVVR